MPLGDSITEGYIEPDPIIYDGYRKKLKSMLEKNGLIFDFVGSNSDGSFDDKQHEGHGGFSAQNYARLSGYELLVNVKSYIQSEQPDYVLLHIGTNDINDFANIYNHNNIDTTVTAVGKILDSIYSVNSNIQVILAKIVNRLDNPSTSFSEVLLTTQYNTKLDSLVNVRILSGDKLSIVNMEIALNSTTDLSDAIHPNISGYEKMAPVWLNGIRNVLPKLSAKIFLEGAYSGSNSMTQSLKTAGVITTTQPFNTASWNYEGTEDAGTIPAGVVDWVLVSLRTGIEKSTEVACRAGFVKTDGTIVDLDGTSPLAFVVDQGSYYVVVKHRNHLQIMSAAPVLIQP
ncbi:MAG: hypothetical protein KDC52_19575, partial [Ignavibacteriae bacterium]|nr:hypothetical protein [Ignavibacteriota bacterium]